MEDFKRPINFFPCLDEFRACVSGMEDYTYSVADTKEKAIRGAKSKWLRYIAGQIEEGNNCAESFLFEAREKSFMYPQQTAWQGFGPSVR